MQKLISAIDPRLIFGVLAMAITLLEAVALLVVTSA
jgi:hypothetical protein